MQVLIILHEPYTHIGAVARIVVLARLDGHSSLDDTTIRRAMELPCCTHRVALLDGFAADYPGATLKQPPTPSSARPKRVLALSRILIVFAAM
jgi:hypothetical protein